MDPATDRRSLDKSISLHTTQEKEFKINRSSSIEKGEKDEPADFETAIAATGYGRYHYLLLLMAFPGYLASSSAVSTISYVLSSAECDLNMSLLNKGILNSITYVGTVSTALIWGMLSDTLGRRKILIYGFLSLGIIEVIGSMSQSFEMLVLLKFLAGAIMNGPFAVQMSYISELHPTHLRAKILVIVGMFYTVADLSLPLIAWVVIPKDWEFSLFDGAIVFHSWNVFLALLSLPALVGGMSWTFVKESPKFLMSRGNNKEAMEVFRHIYSINTGNPPELYPIKTLIDEVALEGRKPEGLEALKGGFKQMAPLFHKQHLKWLTLLCVIGITSNFGGNAMRLWFPQIATIIEDYNVVDGQGTTGLCEMLSPHTSNVTSAISKDEHVLKECIKLSTGFYTYFNSLIVNSASIVSNTIGALTINTIGKKYLGSFGYLVTAVCILVMPWTTGKVAVVALFALLVSLSFTAALALNAVIMDLFPTSLRVMAVAIYIMIGRVGTISGTIAFSSLLEIGCLQPFVILASLMSVSAIGCLLLPNTTLKRMV